MVVLEPTLLSVIVVALLIGFLAPIVMALERGKQVTVTDAVANATIKALEEKMDRVMGAMMVITKEIIAITGESRPKPSRARNTRDGIMIIISPAASKLRP